MPPIADGVDVVVCAGDLAPIGTDAVRYAAEEWSAARHILYVPGNHEYYGTDIDRGRITHHAPTPRSIAARFHGSALNPAFASNLERLIARYQPALWIRGHMHKGAVAWISAI